MVMAENRECTLYVGNLDERVSDRVLYDILIQAGRIVHLYIPRDRETNKPKGYAFAQYESEEIADYAVRLFSGLVTLYSKTLKFGISGKDKPSVNLSVATPSPTVNSFHKPRPPPVPYNELEVSPHSARLSASSQFSEHQLNYEQEPVPPGVSVHQNNGYRSQYDSNGYDYSRRVFGTALDNISRHRLGGHDTRYSTSYYPSY